MGSELSVDMSKGVWPLTLAVALLLVVHLIFPDPAPSIINPVSSPVMIRAAKDLLSTFAFFYFFMWTSVTLHKLVIAIGGYRELLRLVFCDEEPP